MSNGYNTYVSNQSVGPQSGTSQTVNANNPGDWQVVANDLPYGYTGVQTFPDVQQLTNNWCGSLTNWSSCSNPSDLPLAALHTLTISYRESSPSDANSVYEFAPDIWADNYGADVMFWVDTSPKRCTDNGLNSSQIIGQAVLAGQHWTVYRYGGQPGDEIIFILNGSSSTNPAGDGSCARQTAGTVDIKAGFDWLVSNSFLSSNVMFSQLNTGWEITSADNTTFTVTGYSINIS